MPDSDSYEPNFPIYGSIRLKKRSEERVRVGHPWIFSNEIEGDFRAIPSGALVEVGSADNRFLGIGYVNPHSLITVRILTREREEIGRSFFKKRIEAAHKRRVLLYPDRTSYRLCYSEGDFLPGLIVDKYEEFLIVQTLTAGMEGFKEVITDLLGERFNPKGIISRDDTRYRTMEGLPLDKGKVIRGETPSDYAFRIYGLVFHADLLGGQKTGFYLDQADNRMALKGLVKGRKVLDAFSYSGAWGIAARHFGAGEATFVDASGQALELAQKNVELNDLSTGCAYYKGDVFNFLRETKELFDVIILDPPAFVKSKAKIKEAMAGYIDLNRKAMEKIVPGGILVTCSCSYHISITLFEDLILKAARLAKRTVRLLERRTQAKDHPILLAVPETEYLKCLFLEIL